MKYLKTYEETISYVIGNGILQRFVLLTYGEMYHIYEINVDDYTCKLLYMGNEDIPNIKKLEDTVGYFYRMENTINLNSKVLYQSDNLDKLLNKFELLINTDKYNI